MSPTRGGFLSNNASPRIIENTKDNDKTKKKPSFRDTSYGADGKALTARINLNAHEFSKLKPSQMRNAVPNLLLSQQSSQKITNRDDATPIKMVIKDVNTPIINVNDARNNMANKKSPKGSILS